MIRRRDIDVPRPRNRSCRAIVLNIVRDRSVDLTRKRVRSLCGVQHMVALGPRSLCGVQTGGSVDGVCIIQECVCRRYGGERRTIVMHMFRADAVPHTTTLFSPSLFLFRPRQPSLSVPILPPRSNPLRWFFGRWPTPTPSKNLLCSPPREPVSQRFHLFAKEVCEVYCVSRRGWSLTPRARLGMSRRWITFVGGHNWNLVKILSELSCSRSYSLKIRNQK